MNDLIDKELEQCVLGACMQKVSVISDLIDMGIDSDSFGDYTHKKTWEAINQAAHATETYNIDALEPVIVHKYLRKTNIEAVTVGYVADLMIVVTNTANVRHHATQLIDLATRRKIVEHSQQVAQQATDINMSVEDLVTSLQNINQGTTTGLVGIEEAVAETTSWSKQNKDKDLLGTATKFKQLDELTNGLQPGQFMILAARPSKGKSALAWQIAKNIASQGAVLFVSLEMDAKSLVLRSLSQSTGLSIADISRNNIPSQAQEIYDYAVSELAELPIHIDERGSVHLNGLRASAQRVHRREPLSLVVIDYLQLMQAKGVNREQEVSQVSRGLKALAMDLKIPVLACAQLNRSIEMRVGEASRPTLSDLRDSGQIEQDADIVSMLWWGFEHCSDIENGHCELLLRKNRQGQLGTVNLKWEAQWVQFAERQIDGKE